MRILFTADIHAYKFPHFAGTTGMNKRLAECIKAIGIMGEYASLNDIDHVVFAGDILHTPWRIDAETYCRVWTALKFVRSKVKRLTLLVGNHEFNSTTNPNVHFLRPFESIADIVDTPITYEYGKVRVHCVPYMLDRVTYLNILKSLSAKNTVCVSHMPVNEAILSNGMKLDTGVSAAAYEKFMLTILGDFHRPQNFLRTGYYVGAPLQQNKGEEGEAKRFLVFDTGSSKIFSIRTHFPEFITWNVFTDKDLKLMECQVRIENYNTVKTNTTMAGLVKAKYPDAEVVIENERPETPSVVRLDSSGKEDPLIVFKNYLGVVGKESTERLVSMSESILKEAGKTDEETR